MLFVVGENVIDLISGRDSTPHPLVGGGPATTAVALSRLGVPVAFAARLGGDAYATMITDRLAGLPPEHWVHTDSPSTVATIHLDDEGQATYAFDLDGAADFGWQPGELPTPRPGDAVHLGSLAAYLPPGADVIEDWIDHLGQSTVVSFDPNIRPSALGDLDAARARTERYAARTHLMRVSRPDLLALYGNEPPASVARRWLHAGCGLVVVTDGGREALAYHHDGIVVVSAPRVSVVDTVGAGDTFNAGSLAWLHTHDALTPEAFAKVAADEEALRAMLMYAYAASSLNCMWAGANPPTAAEVERFLAG